MEKIPFERSVKQKAKIKAYNHKIVPCDKSSSDLTAFRSERKRFWASIGGRA